MSKSTPPEVEIRARVDRLRELLAKATPGPWQVNGCRGKIVTGNRKTVYHGIGPDGVEIAAVWFNEKTGEGFRDAHLIVEAINALPDLLSALTPQDDVVEKMARAICDKLPEATSREGYINEYTLARACLEALGGGDAR